ncbi:glycosyltransferase family 2 protein [Spirosoma validum]|uniref:Glycosyltransferase family 2 protein n=1 Tax=Spirosoma validum TaxID=2771355 RepID=A0A927B762_9BACT|nr:glycosyltransferase family 2 protein [Spirosoma validum]MBD2756966.1 glycosyltransferase family 2 protein [Spirosoma validum]
MCTYNGERYVLEQLASIAKQERLPDELIVVDDGSTDSTVNIVRQFAESVPFTVKFYENQKNLGSTKSFERAVSACTGDLIAFADQDDVWREDRLSKTEAYFHDNPSMDAVFSDAEIINDDSVPQGRKIWEEVQFTPEAQTRWLQGEAYQMLYFSYVVTGATLAVRRSVLPTIIPFPTNVPVLIHDAWIALILALHEKIGFIDECLIFYRQHTQQQVGFKPAREKVTLRDRFTRGREGKMVYVLQLADRYHQLYKLLNSRTDIDKHKIVLLKRMQDHLAQRTKLSAGRFGRVVPVFRELGRGNYQLFGGHWWLTIIGDLLED